MSERATAEGYARVILETIVGQWQSSLTAVADALEQNPDLASDIASVEGALPNHAGAEVQNFVKTLLQANDLNLLPQITSALGASLRGDAGPLSADITSAVDLDEDAQERIRRKLSGQYGEEIVFSFDVDPSLLGGLRIRVGDQLTDNSVANRLLALRDLIAAEAR